MPTDVRSYLAEVQRHLHLDPTTERRVISELAAHFQEKTTDLRGEGLGEPEAVKQAIDSFGDARRVARLMYEAYSRGSWAEAFLSCQPHILVATLFATHLWRYPAILVAAFAAIGVMAVLGWRSGTPTWTYSWAGYGFFPPLAIAYLCRGVFLGALSSLASGDGPFGAAASLLGMVGLCAATLWLFASTAVRASRRDWIHVSLMLLPLSVLGIWAYTVEQTGDFLVNVLGGALSGHNPWDGAMARLCAGLGLTAAAFVRMRPRLLKGVAVVVIGILAGPLVVRNLRADIGLGGLLVVALGLFLLFMSPLVIHALLSHAPTPTEGTEEAHAS